MSRITPFFGPISICSLSGDKDDVENYSLEDVQTDHTCGDSSCDRQRANAIIKMKSAIKQNPLGQPLPNLYETVRAEVAANLNSEERSQFLLAMGKFSDVASSLYSVQRSFVPENPKDQLELDTMSEWFNYCDGTEDDPPESIVFGHS